MNTVPAYMCVHIVYVDLDLCLIGLCVECVFQYLTWRRMHADKQLHLLTLVITVTVHLCFMTGLDLENRGYNQPNGHFRSKTQSQAQLMFFVCYSRGPTFIFIRPKGATEQTYRFEKEIILASIRQGYLGVNYIIVNMIPLQEPFRN